MKEVEISHFSKLSKHFNRNEMLYYYKRIYKADNKPSFVLEFYISKIHFNLTESDLAKDTVYHKLMNEQNVIIHSAKRKKLIEKPNHEIASILQTSTFDAIINLENIFYDQQNQIIDFSIVWTSPNYVIQLIDSIKKRTLSVFGTS